VIFNPYETLSCMSEAKPQSWKARHALV